jgi:hypothetical protein
MALLEETLLLSKKKKDILRKCDSSRVLCYMPWAPPVKLKPTTGKQKLLSSLMFNQCVIIIMWFS